MIFAFAEFELDAERRTLKHKGELVRVEGKPFDLLTYLVENRGRLVTKQELTEVIWGGAVVSRSTLPITVYAARKAIGQDHGRGGPVATVGRQGYRFIGDAVVGEGGGDPRFGQPPPLVGRADIIAELTRLLSESRAGQGRIGLLTGEAGVGKSRTARELAAVARGFGISAWTGHATDGTGAPAFWTWQPIIRASLESLSERQLAALLKGGVPPEVDRLFPELAVNLPRHPRLPAVGGAAAYHRVHETIARLVVGAPSTRARLFILEDLQWADRASLELLLHVSTRLADARLLVIGTLRDQDAKPGDARYELLHQLFRAAVCRRIDLPPLTATDVAQFVTRLTRDPDSSELAARIYEKTQGNPFFVEETVRALQTVMAKSPEPSGRRLDPSRLPVPDAVKVVIRRRLRTVSASTQGLLAMAAVIGVEFDTALLQHLAQSKTRESLSQLEEAAAARLVSPIHDVGAVARFTHVLIRDTIYQDLPAAQRSAFHLRIAELLERQAGPDPDRFLNELAFHFHRSLPTAAAKAFAYSLRAARMAHDLFACDKACSLYERALEAWAFQDESQRDHVSRCMALLGMAHCSLTSRHKPDARPLVEDAIRLARAVGRPDLLALGIVLANIYASAGHPTVGSIREVTEALDRLPEGLPSVRGYLLSRVASDVGATAERQRELAVEAMDLISASEESEKAHDLLRPDLALIRAEALRFALGSFGPGDLGLCHQLATRAIRLARGDDLLGLWVAHSVRAKANLTLGDATAADDDVRRSVYLASRLRAPLVDFENLIAAGYRAQFEGRFGDAQRDIDRLGDAVWPVVPSHREFVRRLRALQLRDERGVLTSNDVDPEFLERAPALLHRIYHFTKPSAGALVCRLLLAAGVRDMSLVHFERLAERGFDAIARDHFYLSTLCDLAAVCREFGDELRAAELYALLTPHAALSAVETPLHYKGPVSYYLGMLAVVLGSEANAIAHFEAAAASSARVGARPMLNRSRLELARLLIERTDAVSRAQVAFLVTEGLDCARLLEMTKLAGAFEWLRRRLESESIAAMTGA